MDRVTAVWSGLSTKSPRWIYVSMFVGGASWSVRSVVGLWVMVVAGFGSLSVCASVLMRDVSGVAVAIVAAVSIVVMRLDMMAYVT